MSNGLLFLWTVLIWGSTWLAIKYQLGVVAPEVSIAYRFTLAAGLLLAYVRVRRLDLRLLLRDHAFIALQGLLLFSLNYILVYEAEIHLTSGLVAIVFSLIVITNALFGSLFLRSPLRANVLAGALLGIAGLALIFHSELRSLGSIGDQTLGLALSLGGVLSASLGNIVAARNQRAGIPVVISNTLGMSYGAVLMFLLAALRGAPLTFDWGWPYLLSLLFLAVFGSVIAFGAYLTLLGRIGPDRAAFVTVLLPIVALALSTFFEGLRWDPLQAAGVPIVLLGNALALRSRPRPG